jgi:hypothetical protein
MSVKYRNPTGPALYVAFWIGAVLIGLGFLVNLPTLIPEITDYYSQNRSGAVGLLIGKLVVWGIGGFCIIKIISIRKERKRRAEEAEKALAPLENRDF